MSFNLERALEDLAEAGAARRSADDDALTSRVSTMAGRIRRRRALRYTGTTVVAACAVGALALGVTYVPGLLGRGPVGPATSPSAEPSTSADPTPGDDETIDPLDLDAACGASIDELTRKLYFYAEMGKVDGPVENDAGWAVVRGVTQDVNGAAVELDYMLPSGAELLELGWTVLVADADGVIVGALETGLGEAVSPPGVTSTGTTTALPTTSCADGTPLVGTYDVVGVAEAHGTRAGTPYLERVASEPKTYELGSSEPAPNDPVAAVFACGQPGPDSIHTLPDAGGLTFAVDLPAGPWAWDDLPEIPATIGTSDGLTILANLGQGANLALVDAGGTVVGFVRADSGDVGLGEIGPTSPFETQTPQLLVTCGADGEETYLQPLEGTFTAWPYVTASLKEIVDAEGNAESSSQNVIVIANPQEVTFTN